MDSICFCALSLSKLEFEVLSIGTKYGDEFQLDISVDTIFLFHAPIKIDEIKTGQATSIIFGKDVRKRFWVRVSIFT